MVHGVKISFDHHMIYYTAQKVLIQVKPHPLKSGHASFTNLYNSKNMLYPKKQ